MATAPKCRVCGVAHWSGEPHVFASTAEPAPARAKAVAASLVADERDALIASLRARIAELEPDALAWRDRKAANRARMAKSRTRKQKAKRLLRLRQSVADSSK